MLTLNEIRNVNFRKSNFGGYRAEDVEVFIDEVQLSYDSLLKENAELLKRLESLTAKLEEYQQEEDSIRNALMNAQKVGDASLRDAKHKAEIILKDATIKAEKIVSNAQLEIHRERDVIEKMQRDIADFKAKLLKVYKEHLTIINSIPNEDIMQQDTRDALSSVPMLDRDVNSYVEQQNRDAQPQDDYAYADRSFGGNTYADEGDSFAGGFDSEPVGAETGGFNTSPDAFGMDATPQPVDFRSEQSFEQRSEQRSEQPVMPREHMNQSRGGFTVNIDDNSPIASTTTLPPPMTSADRGRQLYNDDAPYRSYADQNDGFATGGDSSGGDNYERRFSYNTESFADSSASDIDSSFNSTANTDEGATSFFRRRKA